MSKVLNDAERVLKKVAKWADTFGRLPDTYLEKVTPENRALMRDRKSIVLPGVVAHQVAARTYVREPVMRIEHYTGHKPDSFAYAAGIHNIIANLTGGATNSVYTNGCFCNIVGSAGLITVTGPCVLTVNVSMTYQCNNTGTPVISLVWNSVYSNTPGATNMPDTYANFAAMKADVWIVGHTQLAGVSNSTQSDNVSWTVVLPKTAHNIALYMTHGAGTNMNVHDMKVYVTCQTIKPEQKPVYNASPYEIDLATDYP